MVFELAAAPKFCSSYSFRLVTLGLSQSAQSQDSADKDWVKCEKASGSVKLDRLCRVGSGRYSRCVRSFRVSQSGRWRRLGDNSVWSVELVLLVGSVGSRQLRLFGQIMLDWVRFSGQFGQSARSDLPAVVAHGVSSSHNEELTCAQPLLHFH